MLREAVGYIFHVYIASPVKIYFVHLDLFTFVINPLSKIKLIEL